MRVRYVPAAYQPTDAYARAWFALEALGETRLHQRLFDAVHREGSLPGRGATIAEVGSFLVGEGLDAARVRAAMGSPATDAKMNAAREFARQAVQLTLQTQAAAVEKKGRPAAAALIVRSSPGIKDTPPATS